MKILTYLFSFLILFTLNLYSANEKKPPNILLIVADDMSFTDIGAYGSEIETPNIDCIAKEGVNNNEYRRNSCVYRTAVRRGVRIRMHRCCRSFVIRSEGPVRRLAGG